MCLVRSRRSQRIKTVDAGARASQDGLAPDRLLEPIFGALVESIRGARVKLMDETPVKVGGKKRKKGKMRTAYFWPVYGDQHEVAFPYARSRARRHLDGFLADFEGTLVSDGYEAYARFAAQHEKIVHALCWAHTRRGFVKAENVEPARSAKALEWIRALYEIERGIADKGLEGEAKLALRGQRSRPLVAAFFGWLEQELVDHALLPTNAFTKAARYALERQMGLEVFLADPEVPLDTNVLERALRPIPMGRKNWMFCFHVFICNRNN